MEQQQPTIRRLSLLLNVSLSCAALILVFFIGEFIVRFLGIPIFQRQEIVAWIDEDYRQLHEFRDELKGYALKPDVTLQHTSQYGEYDYEIRTGNSNSFGYRLPQNTVQSSQDAPLLWNFGDSQTFGFGVSSEKTYADRLRLNGYDSINFGVPGFTVWQEQELFRQHVFRTKRKPDIVTFSIYWGNDIGEHGSIFTGFEYRQPPPALPIVTRAVRRVENFIDKKSSLYHFMSTRSLELIQKLRNPKMTDDRHTFNIPESFYINTESFGYSVLEKHSYALVQNFISTINIFPFEDYPETQFYLLLLPSKEMVFQSQSEPENVNRINQAATLLATELQGRAVHIIDLLPKAADDDKYWFFSKDTHLNEYGHQQIAEFLHSELTK